MGAVPFADLIQTLHVGSAFWLVSGLIGRNLVFGLARRSREIGTVRDLLDASGAFEQRMIVPGSSAVVVSGLLTMWAQGLPLWAGGTRWVSVSLIAFMTVLPIVPLIFLPRGRAFAEALDRAVEAGRVTPELSAAFRDPLVAAARTYELVVVGFVLVLMVTKPF